MGPMPSSFPPGPDLCQEGTQISGGGPEPHLPNPSTEATTKGSLGKLGLRMKGRRLNHSEGPGRELTGDTVASELASGPVGGGQSDGEAPHYGWCSQHALPRVHPHLWGSAHPPGLPLPWGRPWGQVAAGPRAPQAL